MHLLSDLAPELAAHHGFSAGAAAAAARKVLRDMQATTAELFRAFKGEFSGFQPLPNAFEHFGLDFMVDEDLKVWLLEVNPGPDFRHTRKTVVTAMLDASVTVALDRTPFATTAAATASAAASTAEGTGAGGRAPSHASPLASPLARAKAAARGTGFTAVYADEWGASAAGGNGMRVF